MLGVSQNQLAASFFLLLDILDYTPRSHRNACGKAADVATLHTSNIGIRQCLDDFLRDAQISLLVHNIPLTWLDSTTREALRPA